MRNLKFLYRLLSKRYQTIQLDYQVNPKPRYGQGLKVHEGLQSILAKNDALYGELLHSFLPFVSQLSGIETMQVSTNDRAPVWNNGFLPGLDMVAIYGLLAYYLPQRYIEIGSGNSTKMARKAIQEQGLKTKITSVDPFPRTQIDTLADEVIRKPFENLTDYAFITTLQANDVLFIDNSHRSFANSDVTVCFMEILPLLHPGVIVHIHDVFLPSDYPQAMCDRYYNEQYLLAMLLLGNPERYSPLFPCYYISENKSWLKCYNRYGKCLTCKELSNTVHRFG